MILEVPSATVLRSSLTCINRRIAGRPGFMEKACGNRLAGPRVHSPAAASREARLRRAVRAVAGPDGMRGVSRRGEGALPAALTRGMHVHAFSSAAAAARPEALTAALICVFSSCTFFWSSFRRTESSLTTLPASRRKARVCASFGNTNGCSSCRHGSSSGGQQRQAAAAAAAGGGDPPSLSFASFPALNSLRYPCSSCTVQGGGGGSSQGTTGAAAPHQRQRRRRRRRASRGFRRAAPSASPSSSPSAPRDPWAPTADGCTGWPPAGGAGAWMVRAGERARCRRDGASTADGCTGRQP